MLPAAWKGATTNSASPKSNPKGFPSASMRDKERYSETAFCQFLFAGGVPPSATEVAHLIKVPLAGFPRDYMPTIIFDPLATKLGNWISPECPARLIGAKAPGRK